MITRGEEAERTRIGSVKGQEGETNSSWNHRYTSSSDEKSDAGSGMVNPGHTELEAVSLTGALTETQTSFSSLLTSSLVIINITKWLGHLSIATPLGIKNMTHLLCISTNKMRAERRGWRGGNNSLIT